MKKLFLLTITGLLSLSLAAQLKIDLIMIPAPPAALTEWASRREVLTLLISGQPGLPPQKFKIKAEFKTTDGTVIGSTDLSRATVFTTADASSPTILFAADVVPLENMVFTGKYKNSLQQTGKLPSDNYMLCLQLVRPTDYSPFSEVKCKNFFLSSMQLPILMKPYQDEILDAKTAQTAITFRWTPVSPRLTEPVTYRLQVYEVLDNQSPIVALRLNLPILDKEVANATQFIWIPQLSFDESPDTAGLAPILKQRLEKGKMFTWIIQSLDTHGNPVSQSDGNGLAFSEPIVFYIKFKAKEKGNR